MKNHERESDPLLYGSYVMGNRISTDSQDAHTLVRDKEGVLKVYPYKMEDALKCSPLPVALEEGVQYLFLPSSKYKDKNFHTHLFADEICDTAGNDVVDPETTVKDKNMNHIKRTPDSNSGYFQFNEYPINKPDYPKFFNKESGTGQSRFAAQSAYSLCKPLPFPSAPDSTFSYTRNGIPLSLFTDDQCTNEYITHLPIPNESNPKNDFYGPFNVNNRGTDSTVYNVPYTDVKTYINPAQATAAKYYKIYQNYPN